MTSAAAAAVAAHDEVYSAWSSQKVAPLVDVTFTIQEAIRAAHPNHHLTRVVNTSSIDLLGFAQAGHAKSERSDDFKLEASRCYEAPPSRLSAEPATLGDARSLARWLYAWDGVDFVIYETTWAPPADCDEHSHFFILAPVAEGAPVRTEWHPKTDALLLAVGDWSRELHDEIFVFDTEHWSKSKLLWASIESSSWDDVILDPAMKQAIISDIDGFFSSRALYESLNVPWKRGVIFHGVPGNGKTVSIKALVNALARREDKAVQGLYVKSLHSRWGREWSIKRIFQQARAVAPCLLVFEDLDSLVAESKSRSYFLNEVDGLESNDGILMIGSTNHLDRLDPAVTKRPSRFDRKYHFKLPVRAERAAYARYWRGKVQGSATVDFPEEACEVVADLTEGYSFAYMKELFVSALLLLARGGDVEPEEETTEVAEEVGEEAGEAGKKASEAGKEAGEAGKEVKVGDVQGEKKTPKARRKIPEVVLPESLRDNALVCLIQRQAAVLLAQMDDEAAAVDEKKAVDSDSD